MFDPQSYKVPAFAPPDLYATTYKVHYGTPPTSSSSATAVSPFDPDVLMSPATKPSSSNYRSEPSLAEAKAGNHRSPTTKSPTADRRTSKSNENVTTKDDCRGKRDSKSSEVTNPEMAQRDKYRSPRLDVDLTEPLKAPFATMDPTHDAVSFYRLVQKVPTLAFFSHDSSRDHVKGGLAAKSPPPRFNGVGQVLDSLERQLSLLEAKAADFDAFALSLDTKAASSDENIHEHNRSNAQGINLSGLKLSGPPQSINA